MAKRLCMIQLSSNVKSAMEETKAAVLCVFFMYMDLADSVGLLSCSCSCQYIIKSSLSNYIFIFITMITLVLYYPLWLYSYTCLDGSKPQLSQWVLHLSRYIILLCIAV